jgi:hypothetical protein
VPLQLVKVASQVTTHTLALHTRPPGQALPHMPQWLLSVRRSRQVPEQLVVPVPQETWQAPLAHTCPLGHVLPHAPQWFRSVCRSRHTPLQSLTLLNDTSFVEAAQALGRQALTQPEDDDLRVTHLFRRCLTRPPRPSESATLLELLHDTRQRLERGELKASDIAPSGDGSAAERAAWTVVARALLNLDETITKS